MPGLSGLWSRLRGIVIRFCEFPTDGSAYTARLDFIDIDESAV